VGIDIWQNSFNNVIEGNNIKYNSAGVALGYSCQENEISENEISHNTHGTDISMSSDRNRVEGNTISENTWGVSVGSKYNVITANVFLLGATTSFAKTNLRLACSISMGDF